MADGYDQTDATVMQRHRGFTILEVIISVGIFSLIITAISVLQIKILRDNQISKARSTLDQQSLLVLRNFTSEIRAAQIPNDGSFPVASSTDSVVSFYADRSGDGIVERIRYFVENGSLKRGLIVPTGQPLSYDSANESVSSMVDNVITAPPYFIYYGSSFDGSTSTPPLTQPVSPADVRLVELHISVDPRVADQMPRTLETRADIRSLKNK